MKLEFIDKLLDAYATNPDAQRRARLLNILLLGIFGLAFLTVLLTMIIPFEEVQEGNRLVIAGTAFLVGLIVVFIINWYGLNQVASWLFLGLLTTVFVFSDTPEEVVFGRVLYLFTIPTLMASVLIRPYSSFVVAGLIGLLINVIAFSELSTFNFVAPFGFLAVALVSWLSARSLEQALGNLRATNAVLEAQSAELTRTNVRLQQEIVEHERTGAALAQQARSLARSNEELQQFAYVASHDLREPLRKVRSYTELLQRRYEGQLDAKADKYITYIVDGATRMQTLVTDLLTYSRVGKEALSLVATDLNVVLNRILVDLEETIQESGTIVTHDPLPTVAADSSQMVQLLQNLLTNAIKFCRQETPRVHFTAERKDDVWVFAVEDNGIGIEPQYIERIFIIFQRLHTIREYPGTGIGLSICKKIVENHNGRIWVESKFGQGTTFYFTLPTMKSVEKVVSNAS